MGAGTSTGESAVNSLDNLIFKDAVITASKMKGKEKEVIEALKDPDEIRVSKTDHNTYLYHKKYGKEHTSIVVRHLNAEGIILTAYKTTVIKEGKVVYRK